MARRAAHGLGWFSIGLGLAELLAGRSLASGLGTKDSIALIRGYGVRELICGVGLLASKQPHPAWLWARVAGDAIDLASLEAALSYRRTSHEAVVLSLLAVLGVTALDLWCAVTLSRSRE